MSIDRIPLPSSDGALWLCGRADIASDPESTLRTTNASTVVCLNQADELEVRFPTYVEWLECNLGQAALWFPITDFGAPQVKVTMPLLREVSARLVRGDGVVMHCAMGQGRAGTMAVCVLMVLGASKHDALATVAANRASGGPWNAAQRDLVDAVEALVS